jgi:ribosomal-protein-alanine N-acetyltransferase
MQYNMTLQPIPIDVDKTKATFAHPECQKLFKYYPAYYYKVGYNPPWIGYFVVRDEVIVGCCGFTGQPKDGNVEIAYGTFKDFEGQGIASFSCRELVSISKKTNPAIIITAKTLPEKNASTKILERNGFVFSGIVPDEDEGDVW